MVNWIIISFLIVIGFFLMIFSLSNREKISIEDLQKDSEYEFFESLDGATYYTTYGSEEDCPLILIHGLSIPSFYYKETAEALSSIGFKVYIYDHFGRGYSDRSKSDYNMSLYQRQLENFIDHLGLDKVTLMGVSMGGAIASNYASKNKEKIEALILNVPFVGAETIGLSGFMQFPFVWDFYLRFVIIKRAITRGAEMQDENDSGADNHFVHQFSIKGTESAFNSLLKNFLEHNFLGDYKKLSALQIPTHVTYAIDDEDVPASSILKALELFPQAESFSFEGGHNILNEKRDEIISLISDFKSKEIQCN